MPTGHCIHINYKINNIYIIAYQPVKVTQQYLYYSISTCKGNTTYRANFDSLNLTSDCTSPLGCQLLPQIEKHVLKNISAVATFGHCFADRTATESAMRQALEKGTLTLSSLKKIILQ